MTIKGRHIIVVIFLLVVSACVEEYWPELTRYEDLLVVDGMITNEPGPYTVKLSISSSVRTPRWIPLPGATVVIRNEQGETELLIEKEEGVYKTSPEGLQGMIGKKYRLEIETKDGKSYQSPFEEIMEPVGLDTIYAEIEYKPDEDLAHDLEGLQFYLDSKSALTDTNYLMWNLYATYKYRSDFKIRYIFAGTLEFFPRPDSLQTCWRTYRVPQVFTSQTADLIEPNIKRFPLHYVDTEVRELYYRYSLLVEQLTLGKATWDFWNEVKEQHDAQGGLYTNQPFQIMGNIKNTTDPEEPVLGQFTVAGVSKQRIFVSRPELQFWFPVCEITQVDIENFGFISLSPPNTWPVYATSSLGGAGALIAQECMDCRKIGGTIEKPDYWIDE